MLWRETEIIQNSPETVKKLKELGKKFFYITNNNTKTRAEFLKKCNDLNYDATIVSKIYCNVYNWIEYLLYKIFIIKLNI